MSDVGEERGENDGTKKKTKDKTKATPRWIVPKQKEDGEMKEAIVKSKETKNK